MACFLVPAAEAAVVTVASKVIEKKDNNSEGAVSGSEAASRSEAASGSAVKSDVTTVKTSFSRKLKWLNIMLWGGSALLAFEHLWHGEIVPWFPFLTAAESPEGLAEMFHEMATVGVAMAALVTLVWLGMVGVSSLIAKKASAGETEAAPAEE